MILYPNAKLNLGLRVLSRRPDGYHNLETLFIPYLGLQDILEVTPAVAAQTASADANSSGPASAVAADGYCTEAAGKSAAADGYCTETASRCVAAVAADGKVRIEISGPKVDWDVTRDLTVRAYQLLDGDFDLPPVNIRLQKHIPSGAGLGGGSADAAFTLKALNELFSLGLDAPALAARAAVLGSDCAFFIYNIPMFGTGRGEILEPFDIDLSACTIRVEVPEGVSVSTREAYAGVDEYLALAPVNASGPVSVPGATSPSESVPSMMPLREALRLPLSEWGGRVVNDFEPSVFAAHPQIAALKQRFYDEGAVYAAMSGSGSSVFGIF